MKLSEIKSLQTLKHQLSWLGYSPRDQVLAEIQTGSDEPWAMAPNYRFGKWQPDAGFRQFGIFPLVFVEGGGATWDNVGLLAHVNDDDSIGGWSVFETWEDVAQGAELPPEQCAKADLDDLSRYLTEVIQS